MPSQSQVLCFARIRRALGLQPHPRRLVFFPDISARNLHSFIPVDFDRPVGDFPDTAPDAGPADSPHASPAGAVGQPSRRKQSRFFPVADPVFVPGKEEETLAADNDDGDDNVPAKPVPGQVPKEFKFDPFNWKKAMEVFDDPEKWQPRASPSGIGFASPAGSASDGPAPTVSTSDDPTPESKLDPEDPEAYHLFTPAAIDRLTAPTDDRTSPAPSPSTALAPAIPFLEIHHPAFSSPALSLLIRLPTISKFWNPDTQAYTLGLAAGAVGSIMAHVTGRAGTLLPDAETQAVQDGLPEGGVAWDEFGGWDLVLPAGRYYWVPHGWCWGMEPYPIFSAGNREDVGGGDFSEAGISPLFRMLGWYIDGEQVPNDFDMTIHDPDRQTHHLPEEPPNPSTPPTPPLPSSPSRSTPSSHTRTTPPSATLTPSSSTPPTSTAHPAPRITRRDILAWAQSHHHRPQTPTPNPQLQEFSRRLALHGHRISPTTTPSPVSNAPKAPAGLRPDVRPPAHTPTAPAAMRAREPREDACGRGGGGEGGGEGGGGEDDGRAGPVKQKRGRRRKYYKFDWRS